MSSPLRNPDINHTDDWFLADPHPCAPDEQDEPSLVPDARLQELLHAFVPPAVVRACDEGRALLLSPAETGTGVNKQRAVRCNRHVFDNAFRIVCGCIRPGGTLETLRQTRRPSIPPPSSLSRPGPPCPGAGRKALLMTNLLAPRRRLALFFFPPDISFNGRNRCQSCGAAALPAKGQRFRK